MGEDGNKDTNCSIKLNNAVGKTQEELFRLAHVFTFITLMSCPGGAGVYVQSDCGNRSSDDAQSLRHSWLGGQHSAHLLFRIHEVCSVSQFVYNTQNTCSVHLSSSFSCLICHFTFCVVYNRRRSVYQQLLVFTVYIRFQY